MLFVCVHLLSCSIRGSPISPNHPLHGSAHGRLIPAVYSLFFCGDTLLGVRVRISCGHLQYSISCFSCQELFSSFYNFFFVGLWLAFPLAVVDSIAPLYLFVNRVNNIFLYFFCGGLSVCFCGGCVLIDNRPTAESRQYFSVNAPGCITGQKSYNFVTTVPSEQNSYQINFRFQKTAKEKAMVN